MAADGDGRFLLMSAPSLTLLVLQLPTKAQAKPGAKAKPKPEAKGKARALQEEGRLPLREELTAVPREIVEDYPTAFRTLSPEPYMVVSLKGGP